MNKPIIYIVHHVDTEGPLSEPISEIFKRIEITLGEEINIPASKESLSKLQNGSYFKDPSLNKELQRILNPHLISFKTSWKQIDKMLDRVLSKKFRTNFIDSFEGSWIYNWHIMCHAGFETNERGRDLGYLKIFNHYESILKKKNSPQDRIYWHFHPISFYKEAHISATSYENSYHELHQILCRRLVEKKWFPKVNRAGFHTIRPDSNFFLEQWIPFDASNQSIEDEHNIQTDAINGRFGDWKGAPSDWSIYSPDLYDWRKKGKLKRKISRVLNLKTRFRNINEYEIEKAFVNAQQKNNSIYLGITNHDFREMSIEIEEFWKSFLKIAEKYKNKVDYKFSNSVDAFNNTLNRNKVEIRKERVKLNVELIQNLLKVSILNGEIWGAQPYLALKTVKGLYFHDNFDFGPQSTFFYTLDRLTLRLSDIEFISVASNDKYANTFICTIKLENGKLISKTELEI